MTADTLRITAPAKVNLFLSIMGRRPDGYHEIRSVLQTVSLKDTLEFQPTKGSVTLECSDPSVPAGRDNLCFRAAMLMRDLAGRQARDCGVRIMLRKAIPTRAGLGGGSSDAAATLVALNHLWGLGMNPAQLSCLAARLGSDVAFFLTGGTALALGRGEVVVPLAPMQPRMWLVLAKPAVGVCTPWAYHEWDRAALAPGGDCGAAIRAVSIARPQALTKALHNDFERVVPAHHPAVRAAKRDLLRAGCPGALLCGSGSAVFGIARSRQQAERAASALKKKYGWAKAVHTTGRVRWPR
jgi:4-diphosphocytidyl-2-C-methyl-D-erythritol kinase